MLCVTFDLCPAKYLLLVSFLSWLCECGSSAADAGLAAALRFGHVSKSQSGHCSFVWRKMRWGHGRKFNWTMLVAGASPRLILLTPSSLNNCSYITLPWSSSQPSGRPWGSASPAGRGFTGMLFKKKNYTNTWQSTLFLPHVSKSGIISQK